MTDDLRAQLRAPLKTWHAQDRARLLRRPAPHEDGELVGHLERVARDHAARAVDRAGAEWRAECARTEAERRAATENHRRAEADNERLRAEMAEMVADISARNNRILDLEAEVSRLRSTWMAPPDGPSADSAPPVAPAQPAPRRARSAPAARRTAPKGDGKGGQ
jgi:sRNA-binding protein